LPPETSRNCWAAVSAKMSTLMNYTYQSFNMRGRDSIPPYYALISNIAAEEGGHIEIVSVAINSCLNGPRSGFNKSEQPVEGAWKSLPGGIFGGHYIAAAQTALPVDSRGMPWTGDYVFSSGNLILDLLHNFFLENGARTQKLRVYEMTTNPAARTMLGYLFVRGGVHALAYARALETLTGVEMSKMLPIPNIGNAMFPEARRFMEGGLHLKLYRFSPEDYRESAGIWTGTAPMAYTEGLGGSDQHWNSWMRRRPGQPGQPGRHCFELRTELRAGRNPGDRHQALPEGQEPVVSRQRRRPCAVS
jgi:Mn-containing catalase